MNELSLACEIADYAHKVATDNGAQSVASISVVIGEATGVDVEALQLAFSCACVGTLAETARLETKTVPAKFVCEQCKHTFGRDCTGGICPVCGSQALLSEGHNIVIRSMSFETSDHFSLAGRASR